MDDNECGHTDEEHRQMAEEIQNGLDEVKVYQEDARKLLASVMAKGDAIYDYIQSHPTFKVSLVGLFRLIEQSGGVLPGQMPMVAEVVKVVAGLVLQTEGLLGKSSTGSDVPDIFKGLDIPGLDTL